VAAPPSLSASDALQKIAREKVGRLLVTENGQLRGIVTRGDLIRTIQTRQELGQRSEWKPIPPGSPIPQVIYCIQCGAQLPVGTKICPHCNAAQPQ